MISTRALSAFHLIWRRKGRAAASVFALLWLRSLAKHTWWHRSLWYTLAVHLVGVVRSRLPGCRRFRVEVLRREADGEEYAVWWPPHTTGGKARRLWVITPGGMGDGRDFYIEEFLRSGAVDHGTDDWCVFHQPGLAGSKYRVRSGVGLSDPTYLKDFLARTGREEVVVVGFSVGGMLTLRTAEELMLGENAEASEQRLRFVAVNCPDRVRRCFEEFEQWGPFARVDAVLCLHFCRVLGKSGVFARCPRLPRWPLPPCWQHMRRVTEECWAQRALDAGTSLRPAFEDFEEENFSGALRRQMPCGVLRIQNPVDPIVTVNALDPESLKRCEVWWCSAGGHCGAFGADSGLGPRLRAWLEVLGPHGKGCAEAEGLNARGDNGCTSELECPGFESDFKCAH